MPRCRSTSSCRNDTVEKDLWFIGKIKCCNHVEKGVHSLLATNTIASQLVIGKSCSSIFFFQKGALPLS